MSAGIIITVALTIAAAAAALPDRGWPGMIRPFVVVVGLLGCAALAAALDPLRPLATSAGTLMLGVDGSLVVGAASLSLALLVGAEVAGSTAERRAVPAGHGRSGGPSTSTADLSAMAPALLLTVAALAVALAVLNGSLIANLGVSAPVGATGSPLIALAVACAASVVITPLVASAAVGPAMIGAVRTASRLLRATTMAAAVVLVGMAWLLGTAAPILADPAGIAAALALVATGTVVLFGAVPAHALAARATAFGPALSIAARTAWLPAAMGLAIVAWEQRVLDPSASFVGTGATAATLVDDMRALVSAVAFVTLVGGAVAATWHDDLRHAIAYAFIADGAFVLLALASPDPSGPAAAHDWLPLNALAKTALVAWSLGVVAAHGTASVDRLRGWGRRRPLLALGLVAIAAATFGLPGWGVWSLRLSLARAGAGPFGPLMTAAAWIGLLPYLRLAWAGLGSPSGPGEPEVPVGHEEPVASAPRTRSALVRPLSWPRGRLAAALPSVARVAADGATIAALLALGAGAVAVLMSWAVGGSAVSID